MTSRPHTPPDTPAIRTPAPFVLDLDEEAAPEADPGAAPPVPEADEAFAGTTAPPLPAPRRSRLARWALWSFGGLAGFLVSVAAWDFIARLMATNRLLGMAGLVLLALALFFALALSLREMLAIARLARLDHLRQAAEAAHATADLAAARRVTAQLGRLYAGRVDTAWGLRRFDEGQAAVLDADGLLMLAESAILAPLDAAARAEIEGAARRVATITALVPLAAADVVAVLWANLALIRRIAAIYGGRAGTFGSLRLLRRVIASILAAGAVALADDMLGSIAGSGLASKLSRRFGEGVVNGALTARLGVAAMELCRPLPFRAAERPAVSGIMSRALAGLVPRGGKGGGEG